MLIILCLNAFSAIDFPWDFNTGMSRYYSHLNTLWIPEGNDKKRQFIKKVKTLIYTNTKNVHHEG